MFNAQSRIERVKYTGLRAGLTVQLRVRCTSHRVRKIMFTFYETENAYVFLSTYYCIDVMYFIRIF